jgi:hypothetical protein
MPNVSAFLSAFSLKRGFQIRSYVLSDVSAEHHTITRNKEYEYPITITFTQTGSTPLNEFLFALTIQLQGSKIVSSEYGNPYQCWIDTTQSRVSQTPNEVIIQVMGHSVRVHR